MVPTASAFKQAHYSALFEILQLLTRSDAKLDEIFLVSHPADLNTP